MKYLVAQRHQRWGCTVAVWRVGGHVVPAGTPGARGACICCWRTVVMQ